jgi:hypothetical protein
MLTRIKRFKNENLYSYIMKLCYINSCQPNLLLKTTSVFKSYGTCTHVIPKYFFSYTGNIFSENLDKLIEKNTLLNLTSDIETLFGPFAKYLNENIGFLMSKNFKFCPECFKEGNHYIFHQLSFNKNCLIHNIPLVEHCPFCDKKFELDFNISNRGAFYCPECNMDVLHKYIKMSSLDLIDLSYKSSSYEVKRVFNDALSALIVNFGLDNRVKKNISFDTFTKFLESLILKGEIDKISDSIILKETTNTPFKLDALLNYGFSCGYDSTNKLKDFSIINKSVIRTIEYAISEVSRRISSTYQIEFPKININRTDQNYKLKFSNYVLNVIDGNETTSCAQYAYYLWGISCIFRQNNGESLPTYSSFLVESYQNLILLFYRIYNKDFNSGFISKNILQLAYETVKEYLFEFYKSILDIIIYNREKPESINHFSLGIIDYSISPQAILKTIILEYESCYKIYFFRKDSASTEENKIRIANKNDFGGFELYRDVMIKCSNKLEKAYR